MRRGFLAAFSLLTIGTSVTAHAVTVTNTNDNGPGSLRQAIIDTPAGGIVEFSLVGCPCEIQLTSGELPLNKNLIINGPGKDLVTVKGPGGINTYPVFLQNGFSEVSLAGLTITNGGFGGIHSENGSLQVRNCRISNNMKSSFGGAGISARALTVENSVIENNVLTFSAGGGIGIQDSGSLYVRNSSISGNFGFAAGGIFIGNFATAQIFESTISGNTSTGLGGGIYSSNATTTISNSTISGNASSSNPGGGVLNFAHDGGVGILTVISCTITGNSSSWEGSGIRNVAQGFGDKGEITIGNVILRNSIVASNQAGIPDVWNNVAGSRNIAVFLSDGYNLIGNRGSIPFNGPGDQAGIPGAPLDPHLGPLAMNGGPTKTHLPLQGSPAIDRGKAFGLLTDQRGYIRPNDEPDLPNAPGGDGSDKGAVEIQFTVSAFDIGGRVGFIGGIYRGGAMVKLTDNDQNVRYSVLNPLGRFRFAGVPAGTYTLNFIGKNWVAVPQTVVLTAPALNILIGANRSP